MSEIISEQREKAVELHQRIIVSAQLAQKNLWDMCTSLKEMRDNKLYKEFGYNNFEDYCENEVGMKRRNAYNYIAIVEKVKLENVQPVAQIGVKKLALLATLSEEQQKEVAETVNLEDTTVKELKAEIEKIKKQKEELVKHLTDAEFHQQNTQNAYKHLEQMNSNHYKNYCNEKQKNRELEEKIKELENRPIEVAVVETSDNERRLQETIDVLRRESEKRNDELERQYIEDTRSMRQNFEKSKQQAIDEAVSGKQAEIDNLTYELAKAKSQNGMTNEEKEYRLAYMNAENALKALQSVIEQYDIHSGEAIGLAKAFIFDLKG